MGEESSGRATEWKDPLAGGSGTLLPDDGVLEAQLGGALLDLLLQPGLRSHQVLDELRHPPDGGVAVQALQTWGQIFRDGQRQVGGPRVQAVHDGQLDHLDILIVSLSWRVGEEHVGEGKDTRWLPFVRKENEEMLPL